MGGMDEWYMWYKGIIEKDFKQLFFASYTIHRRHSQRKHTHPYEHARKPYP
jgi:hypothetical protein